MHNGRPQSSRKRTLAAIALSLVLVAMAAGRSTPAHATAPATFSLDVTRGPAGTVVHITPDTPCPPPSTSSSDSWQAHVSVRYAPRTDELSVAQDVVPVAPDGTWHAQFTVVEGGEIAPGPATVVVACTDHQYVFDYEVRSFELTTNGHGYWLVARTAVQATCFCPPTADAVAPFGDAGDFGSVAGDHVTAPVVAIAAEPTTGDGYWMAAADGGVFTYGPAFGYRAIGFFGSLGGQRLAAPIVAIAATPSGDGYWLVGADGGVFAFGAAVFAGSMGGRALAAPIVGMAATSSGRGYWLVGADGGVFAFGDAVFDGSMGGRRLAAPVVGVAATPAAGGYWLVGADGGVFAFGSAPYLGGAALRALGGPVVGIAASITGQGYWLAGRDGGVFAFGDAPFAGSCGSCATVPLGLRHDFVAIAATPATQPA